MGDPPKAIRAHPDGQPGAPRLEPLGSSRDWCWAFSPAKELRVSIIRRPQPLVSNLLHQVVAILLDQPSL